MSYRFARVRENYADLASGHVLRSAPGFPAFPARLGSEMFQRAVARRGLPRVGIWDPLCGSGHLLTTLALLHRRELAWVVGTDLDTGAVRLAAKNLRLLGDDGLAARARELRRRADLLARPGDVDTARAADRLARRLEADGGPLPAYTTVADAFDPAALARALEGRRPDVVVADLPYGETTTWLGRPEGAPLSALLASLGSVLDRDAVVALALRGRRVPGHGGAALLESFRLGTRSVALFRTGREEDRG